MHRFKTFHSRDLFSSQYQSAHLIGDLRKHERTRNCDKPYACFKCDKAFSLSGHLKPMKESTLERNHQPAANVTKHVTMELLRTHEKMTPIRDHLPAPNVARHLLQVSI